MGLREKAIGVYEREKDVAKVNRMKEADMFAEKALKYIREILGDGEEIPDDCGDIIVLAKQPGSTSLRIDGILFSVSASDGYHHASAIKKCPVCGIEVDTMVFNLESLGKALVEPHNKYDCDRMLEIKKEMDDEKNGNIISTEGRLLLVLKDFVRENGGIVE